MAYLAIHGSNCSWGFFAGCISYKSKSPWAAGFPISDDSGWMQYQNREVSKTQRKMATKKYKPNWLDKQPSSTSPYFENSFFRVVSSMAYRSPTSRLIRNRIRCPDKHRRNPISRRSQRRIKSIWTYLRQKVLKRTCILLREAEAS